MSTSSARPDDLDAFARGSRAADEELLASAVELRAAYTEFTSRCQWGTLHADSLISGLNPQFLAFNEEDARWVAAIAAAFRCAGTRHGLARLPDAALAASLRRAGVSHMRGSVTFDDPVAFGFPPTTGYVNDPVNTATGNFVELETDIDFGGLLADLSLARTYNSRSDRVGPFGRGWSSWATTRLRAGPEGAAYEGPDGQRALFARAGMGYGRVAGVGALVEASESGLAIAWFGAGRWEFDDAGLPVAVEREPGAQFRLDHDEQGRLVELVHRCGKHINLEWDGERIVAAVCSDGRHVSYGYDGAGNLVEVETSGAVSRRYRVDGEGRILSVADADGVVEVANVYDDDGRVVQQRSPFGRTTTFAYLPGWVTVTSDDDGGPANTHIHDAGRLVAIVDGDDQQMRFNYDEWGNPVAITERSGAVTIQHWDERARLVRRVLPSGAELAYVYDGADRVVEIAASSGSVMTLRYDGDERSPCEILDPEGGVSRMSVEGGLVREVADPDGVSARFEFDADGNVVAAIDADGDVTRIERDVAGRVTAVVTALGRRSTFSYDERGFLVELRDPAGGTWCYEHSNAGRPTSVTDPTGAHAEIRYGEHGAPAAIVDPLGRVTMRRYDVFGNVAGVVAPDGAASQYGYDALMRLTTVEDPAGAIWRREFDANGNPTAGIDPTGRRREATLDASSQIVALGDRVASIAFERDEFGRVVVVRRSDGTDLAADYDRCGRRTRIRAACGAITRIEYTPGGRVRRELSHSGRVLSFEYDRCGRLAARIDGAGRRTEYRYDAEHALVEQIHPTGEATRVGYDEAGRLVEVSEPGRGVTRCRYDAAGRRTEIGDRVAGVRRFEYDAAGQRVAAIDANGNVTRYDYGERGWLTAITDPLGATTRCRYDAVGRLVEQIDPLGRVTTFAHDAAGRLVERVDGDGRATRWSYDESGRVRGFGAAGREPITIERDGLGRATAILEPGAPAIRLRWDKAGRLVERSRGDLALRWRYGPDGERAGLGYPDGSETTYHYDAGGQLTGQDHPALGAIAFERDPAGRLVAATAGDMRARWRYDDGELVEYRFEAAGARRAAQLRRNPDGLVVAATADGIVQLFSYDPAGQLLSAETAAGPLEYSYDANGRLVRVTSPADTVEFEYDRAGQLLARRGAASAATEYEYDGAGRRVRETHDGVSRTWRWDDLGRLVEIHSSEPGAHDERTTRVGIDALGELAEVGGAPLLWDATTPGSPPAWIDRRAVVARGVPWALAGGEAAQWLVPDWQGTVGDGARDPWGAAVDGTADADGSPRLGYRGEVEFDGQTWLRNRIYEAEAKSFLQPDALAPVPGTAAAANPYHYAANNPISLVDPLGLRPVSDAELRILLEQGRSGPNFKKLFATAGTWALGGVESAVTWGDPATALARRLDAMDNPVADALSFGVKFRRAPITTMIGLGIGGYGVLRGDVDNVKLKDGEIVYEWDPNASFRGLTLGGSVNLFGGDTNHEAFKHEVYHSYQATGWGDAFLPMYAVGGGWGVASSALAGRPQWSCFFGVSDDRSYGQPFELVPELMHDSTNCH